MKRLLVWVLGTIFGVVSCSAPSGEEPLSSTAPQPTQAVQTSPQSDPPEEKRPRQPKHLDIWKFDAPIVPLNLAGSELIPPSDPSVLGWWGRPSGANHGTTLLTGHTVHTGGGEFDDLEHIPLGTVGTLSGVKYTVTRVEIMPKQALAERSGNLFRQHGRPRLVLVTCEGYNWDTGLYADNVVVTLHKTTP